MDRNFKYYLNLLITIIIFFSCNSRKTNQKNKYDVNKTVSGASEVIDDCTYALDKANPRYKEYELKLNNKTLYFEELPEELEGFQIGLVADLHIDYEKHGHLIEVYNTLLNGANKNNSSDPKTDPKPLDALFFLGDLVNYHINELDTDKATLLRKLNELSKSGVYSILGNHDLDGYEFLWAKTPEKNYDKMMSDVHNKCLKWKLLDDKYDIIEHNGAYINLIGIGHWAMCSAVPNRGNMKKARKTRYKNVFHQELNSTVKKPGKDKKDKVFNILLAHDPSILDQEDDEDDPQDLRGISFVISGHTHGQKGFGDGIQKPKLSTLPNPFLHPKKFWNKMPLSTLNCKHRYSSGHYYIKDKQL